MFNQNNFDRTPYFPNQNFPSQEQMYYYQIQNQRNFNIPKKISKLIPFFEVNYNYNPPTPKEIKTNEKTE